MRQKSSSGRQKGRSLNKQTRQEKEQKKSLRSNLFSLKRIVYGILVLGISFGLYALIYSGGYDLLASKVDGFFEEKALENGIRLENIIVEGRHNASTQEISKALAVRKGINLFHLNVHTLKDRLTNLPWVRSAIVQKRFPDTLYIRLREKSPVALWQDKGKTHLIDDQGTLILGVSSVNHHKLLMVSGEEAPRQGPKIVAQLHSFPSLMKRLSGAVLNGGRQWDLLVGAGLRIKLPESDLEKALAYVDSLRKTGHLDNPKIKSIDVRLEDRTFFYLDREEAKKYQVSFQQKKGKKASQR